LIAPKGQDQVLVHVDAAVAERIARTASVEDLATHTDFRTNLRWFCEWLGGTSPTARVLVPDSARASLGEDDAIFAGLEPIWYNGNEGVSVPSSSRRDRVWIVNAAHLPIVDWEKAAATSRHVGADVVVFDGAGQRVSSAYDEHVVVSEDREVLRFERYYQDSPVCADLWEGESAFVVTGYEHAPAVVAHLLRRGWGLESIGALTRRFSVRWSPLPCGHSAFDNSMGTVDGLWRDATAGGTGDDVPRSEPAVDMEPMEWNLGLEAEAPEGMTAGAGDDPADGFELPEDDQAYLWLKRAVDVTASGLGLLVLSPLLLVIAALVKLTSRGPVFFAHKRQGLGGREFFCLKFRSMTVGADAMQASLRDQNEVDGPQFRIADDPRITRVGHILRKLNLDELPQLLNVLTGDMSLVGPRPSPDSENQLCPAWRRTRLSVKPGITGLWQVLRRRQCPHSDFQEWIYYDVEYARHRSLWLDWELLLHTPVAMFAPKYLDRFAAKLERAGICQGSDRLRPIDELRT